MDVFKKIYHFKSFNLLLPNAFVLQESNCKMDFIVNAQNP